jgi:hypothetical protein
MVKQAVTAPRKAGLEIIAITVIPDGAVTIHCPGSNLTKTLADEQAAKEAAFWDKVNRKLSY